MKNIVLPLLVLAFALQACRETPARTAAAPLIPPASILKDGRTTWSYLYQLNVLADCTTLDTLAHTMPKGPFLDSLLTGRYLPLLLVSPDTMPVFRLHPLAAGTPDDVPGFIKNWAEYQKKHFNMMGHPMPPYRFTDLDGKTYDADSMKGKVLVVKCWFISCKPCVAEMPELNEVVEQYKDRNDILFVSLALDEADELRKFLGQTAFRYATVPAQETYIHNLGIRAYPTHLLVNKAGIVTMVAGEWEKMKPAFEKAIAL